MSPRPISRRSAIILGGLGVAEVATGATGWLATAAATGPGGRLQPGATGDELTQPPVLDSQGAGCGSNSPPQVGSGWPVGTRARSVSTARHQGRPCACVPVTSSRCA
jgi:hypothetical protein